MVIGRRSTAGARATTAADGRATATAATLTRVFDVAIPAASRANTEERHVAWDFAAHAGTRVDFDIGKFCHSAPRARRSTDRTALLARHRAITPAEHCVPGFPRQGRGRVRRPGEDQAVRERFAVP